MVQKYGIYYPNIYKLSNVGMGSITLTYINYQMLYYQSSTKQKQKHLILDEI